MKTLSIKSTLLHLMIFSHTLLWSVVGVGQTTVVFDTPGPGSFIVPAGVTELTVECWGAGGAGARATSSRRAGGGGGAYARSTFTVFPGSSYSYSVGQGGISSIPQNGGNTDFGSGIVVAEGGKTPPLNSNTGGSGGLAANSTGDVRFSGGSGGGGGGASCGGGGGGAAGTTENGVAGVWTGTAGIGGANDGGSGGSGGCFNGTSGNPGTGYGGGGGGPRYGAAAINGANGANGAIRITYVLPIVPVFVQQSVGQQLFFDNAYVTTTEPVFRVEAPNNGGAFNTVRFEISPTWDFSGASYTQTFSGSYANSQVDEFTCNNLSPAFPANPNTVYYVRVRYSSNGGSTWSLYSAVNSFTIKPDCDVDWYQWEDPQLESGAFAYSILNQLSVGNAGAFSYQGPISWSNHIVLQQISVTTPGVLNFLSAYVTGGSGGFGTAPCGDIRLGLYDVSGNLVATTNAAPAVNAWNSLPTLTNPMLAVGTYYVGVMLTCNNMFIPMIDGSGGSYGVTYPFASGYPATIPLGAFTPQGFNYLFYAGIDEMSNILLSNPIYFASFLGAEAWDEVTFNVNAPGRVQVMYDNGGVRTLVPNAVLPGNQAGFTSSPIDISGLDPAVYHTLYLRAIYVSTILDVNEWKVTVTYPQSTAPTSISGTGPICFGTNATLTANGGTLQPGHQWGWFTGSCGGTLIGTGPSITVSPSTTTTYYVGAVTADGCPAGPCVSGTVTLPTVGTTLAINNDVAVCLVNSNNFVHFYEPSGRLLASINSNGQNLGNVTMTAYVDGAPALVPACDDPTDPQYMTHVMQRHWVITPEFQPSADVIVRLPYDDNGAGGEYQTLRSAANANANDNDDIVDYASIVLSKYAGPANVNNSALDNCPASGGDGGTELFTQSSLSGQSVNSYLTGFQPTAKYADFDIPAFSEFWLHGSMNDSPLPVALTNFSGDCATSTSGKVIRWTTASEQNSSHFVLESSIDGVSWTAVETVAAAGNSNQENHYESLDRAVHAGIVYYRLAQVDNDGQTQVYGPIAVTCDETDQFVLYPNPATNQLNILIPAKYTTEDFVVQLFNPEGRIILSESLNNSFSNKIEMDISAVAKGVYFIQGMTNDGVVYTDKLVKE